MIDTARMIVLLCGPVILAGCGAEEPSPPPPVRPVLSMVVQPSQTVESGFVGVVAPQVSVVQSFRIGGTLLTRGVNVGDQVAAGAVVGTLDSTTYDLALETTRANLLSADVQYANAVAAESRIRTLNQSDVVAAANLEEAELQTEAARAALVQAKSRVSKAEEQLDYTHLKASIDGVVTAVGAEPGEVVGAGSAVVTIAQPQARDLVIDVPEEVVQSLKPGARFNVAPQLAPDAVVLGSLREIAPQADPVTRSWRLRIGLEAPNEHFWLGTTAVANLDVASTGTIQVPASAIRKSADGDGVWVIDEAAGNVSLRQVQVEPGDNGGFRVLSGLAAGERIVVSGANVLSDGQQIKLENERP